MALKDDLLQYPEIKCIFTDVFDTLLLRRVHPENTKRLAAKRLSAALGINVPAEEIYCIRAALEREFCETAQSEGMDPEFCLEGAFMQAFEQEIYKRFGVAPSNFSALVKSIELDVERSVQFLDRDVVEALKAAKFKGIRIVAVSDFYLPSSWLNSLFEHHEIQSLFDKIYVSCENCVSKRSGRLYDKVLSDLGLTPDQVLMIGDNPHSDDQVPRSKGMRTQFLDRSQQQEFYRKQISESTNSRAIERRINAVLNQHQALPFREFAFTLYGFIEKLHRKLLAQGARDVFFLSREGEFLKHLFEAYQDGLGCTGEMRIKAHYLLVSRRATFIASRKPLLEESFETLLVQYKAISAKEFFHSLNFPENAVREIAAETGIQVNKRERNFHSSASFQKIRSSIRFQFHYEEIRNHQKRLLIRYLDSFGVDYHNRDLVLVDVGWKGTIQDHIHALFEGDVRVSGYYMGLLFPGQAKEGNQKEGLVFSALPAISKFFALYSDNRPLYEMMLDASHGSARCYLEDGQMVCVALEPNPEEQRFFETMIAPIQREYSQIFDAISQCFACSPLCMEDLGKFPARMHARMMIRPTPRELNLFTDMHHLENFGVFETSRFQVEEKIPWTTRFFNLVRLLRSPREVLFSGWWVPLTLKQLGLGQLTPFYSVVRFLKLFGRP